MSSRCSNSLKECNSRTQTRREVEERQVKRKCMREEKIGEVKQSEVGRGSLSLY